MGGVFVMKLTFVIGTRPEAIKLAPVIKEAQKSYYKIRIIDTQQQPNAVPDVLKYFNLKPTKSIPIPNNFDLLYRVGYYANQISDMTKYSDVIFVQGDTISTLAGALSGFFHKIPVAHVEAGMRSFDLNSPYPEEGTRRMISMISKFHFCPTDEEKEFLISENLSDDSVIKITGNTVIDALSYIIKNYNITIPADSKGVLMTLHRRESFDKLEPLINVANRLVEAGIPVTYIKHTNPAVVEAINKTLKPSENLTLLPPQNYPDFIKLMAESKLILTDSGGIQEEAPFLGKQYLVMRDITERWQAWKDDRIIGTDPDVIFERTEREYFYGATPEVSNVYGDGLSSTKILNIIRDYYSL